MIAAEPWCRHSNVRLALAVASLSRVSCSLAIITHLSPQGLCVALCLLSPLLLLGRLGPGPALYSSMLAILLYVFLLGVLPARSLTRAIRAPAPGSMLWWVPPPSAARWEGGWPPL
jgi:hypothetical protein